MGSLKSFLLFKDKPAHEHTHTGELCDEPSYFQRLPELANVEL